MAVQYNPGIVTDGLVLCLDAANFKSYLGTGTGWNDLSGNGITTSLINNPIFNTINSGIFTFDGIDEYVDLGSPSPSILNLQYATQEVWVKLNAPNNGLPCQVIARQNTNNGTFTIAKSSTNRWAINIRNTSNSLLSIDLNTLPTTDWINITQTYDGTTLSGYVNGILDISSTSFSGPLDTSGTLFIQIARNTNLANFLPGSIANIKVYNRALSAPEISQNFNALRGRFGI